MEQTPQQSSPTQNNAQFSSDSMIKETSEPKSHSSMLLYSGIAFIVIVLLSVGGNLLFAHHKSQTTLTIPAQQTIQQVQNTTQSLSPTPVISPVTSANVDKTLDNTDTTMQQSMNQVTSDLKDINNINASQDNTSGL